MGGCWNILYFKGTKREGVNSKYPGYGPVVGSCKPSNGLSGYIKGVEYLEKLSDYQLLERKSVLCG
jgi:hypothetical protein